MTATRERIVAAAAALLEQGGREAVSTRAVADAAGVQAPAIYRQFGDKRGLLDAVAGLGVQTYLAGKLSTEPGPDPVADLRAGWDAHVAFGLAHPALYALIYGDPRPGVPPSTAETSAMAVLEGHIHRIARAGRLRVDAARAVGLVHAAGSGTTLSLLASAEPDLGVSDLAREAVLAAITTDTPAPDAAGPAAAASALRAVLPDTPALTASERALMGEWLDRLSRYR